MPHYLAHINVPGYLPTDTEPATFETAADAWEHLVTERNDAWLADDADGGPDYDPVMAKMADMGKQGWWGTVYAETTPGYTGEHDLGVAYTVTMAYGEVCPRCDDHIEPTPDDLHQHMLDSHLEDGHR